MRRFTASRCVTSRSPRGSGYRHAGSTSRAAVTSRTCSPCTRPRRSSLKRQIFMVQSSFGLDVAVLDDLPPAAVLGTDVLGEFSGRAAGMHDDAGAGELVLRLLAV